MNVKKLRVVIYARVATQDQCDDTALEAQSRHIREYAERRGMEVVGEVRVVEPGTTMARSGWHDALLLAAKEGADAVCAKDFSRVARGANTMDQAISDLDRYGLDLITCNPFDSEQHFSILRQTLMSVGYKT